MFKTFGAQQRERAQCAVCGTLERQRLLYLFLRDRTNILTANLSVLHFAPNEGLKSFFRKQGNLCYVVANQIRRNDNCDLELDLTNLNLPDACFDVAICVHVFEHIENDRQAMAEFFRVVKPGGWAIAMVPTRNDENTLEDPSYDTPEKRSRHYGQADHLRYYGWKDFAERLKSAGFGVSIEQPALAMEAVVVERFRLLRDERIYFLRKDERHD